MKTLFALLVPCVLMIATCCKRDDDAPEPEDLCEVPAIVRDLREFGCDFGFEIEGGVLLLPYRILECGTPPQPKSVREDPLDDVILKNGQSVRITYQEITEKPLLSVCMSGRFVIITCYTEVENKPLEW